MGWLSAVTKCLFRLLPNVRTVGGSQGEILQSYHVGEAIPAIARTVSLTRTSVAKWVGKALNVALAIRLKDALRPPLEPLTWFHDFNVPSAQPPIVAITTPASVR